MNFRVILCAFIFSGCTSIFRGPSSTTEPLKDLLQTASNEFQGVVLTPENCTEPLTHLHRTLETVAWDSYSNEELRRDGPQSLDILWKLRTRLHGQLDTMSSSCAYQTRYLFNLMRDTEDYIIEFVHTGPVLNPADVKFQKQPVPISNQTAYPPSLVSEKWQGQEFKFHAGDLMLARGVSFISAIITQTSDNKSHYSHVAFVTVDPKTKKAGTIESYIGTGVTPFDMDFALKNENARLLVLRPKNLELGQKASDIMSAKVKAALAKGRPIPYDYTQDYKQYSKMSCTEVPRSAYDWASEGELKLPFYSSQIVLNNKKFLSSLNLKKGESFSPDDLEIDPRFELVLDWRDYRLIRDSRYKDAILSEMIRWVGDLKYQFRGTAKSGIAKHIILPSRTTRLWPLVRAVTGSPDIDPTLPKDLLGVMTVLGQVGDGLLERVEKADKEFIAKYKRPMTNRQLRDYLEQLRAQDLHTYIEYQYSFIHYALRPDGVYPKPGAGH